LMNYIVFDLEFNTFFKFKQGDIANPKLKNEIIQIGAVKLNEALETIDSLDLIIKPVIYRRINPYVKRKINFTTNKVRKGKPFVKAIENFHTWVGDDAVLCSWGYDDIFGLRDNCQFFGFDALSFDRFINIQQIYMNYRNLTKQPSLESAVEGWGIEVSNPFHDALCDAFYTVDVFRKTYNFSSDVIINWEKVQKENAEKVKELKTFLNQVKLKCPECNCYLQKDREITKPKKYFAFGYCTKCNLHIRNVSRITHSGGEYIIVSNNTILKSDKAGAAANNTGITEY
jgi:inhibitor of KinA sporulation pathway (predicted exonuclease)